MSALQNPKLMGQEQILVPAIKEGLVGLRKEQAHDFHSSLAECKMDVLINGYSINHLSETRDCWVYFWSLQIHSTVISDPSTSFLKPRRECTEVQGATYSPRALSFMRLRSGDYEETTSIFLRVGSVSTPEGTVASCLGWKYGLAQYWGCWWKSRSKPTERI